MRPQALPATAFEYGIEPDAAFERHVLPLFDSAAAQGRPRMSRSAAVALLEDGVAGAIADPAAVKSQYRKLSRLYHPDVGAEGKSPEELEAAKAKFQQVQDAYDLLSDKGGKTWYESIGGNDRNDFSTLALSGVGVIPEAVAKGHEKGGWSHAVTSIDSKLPLFFSSRNAAAAASAR